MFLIDLLFLPAFRPISIPVHCKPQHEVVDSIECLLGGSILQVPQCHKPGRQRALSSCLCASWKRMGRQAWELKGNLKLCSQQCKPGIGFQEHKHQQTLQNLHNLLLDIAVQFLHEKGYPVTQLMVSTVTLSIAVHSWPSSPFSPWTTLCFLPLFLFVHIISPDSS